MIPLQEVRFLQRQWKRNVLPVHEHFEHFSDVVFA